MFLKCRNRLKIDYELIDIMIILMDIYNKNSLKELEAKLNKNNLTMYKENNEIKTLDEILNELRKKFIKKQSIKERLTGVKQRIFTSKNR